MRGDAAAADRISIGAVDVPVVKADAENDCYDDPDDALSHRAPSRNGRATLSEYDDAFMVQKGRAKEMR